MVPSQRNARECVASAATATTSRKPVTWTGVKNLAITAGINNVFDRDPPLSGQVNTFQRGYDPRFTDPLGRALMLRASYKFF